MSHAKHIVPCLEILGVVDVLNLVTHLNHTPILESCAIECCFKNKNKKTCDIEKKSDYLLKIL